MTGPKEQRKPASARRSRCSLSLHRTGQWYKKIHGKFHYLVVSIGLSPRISAIDGVGLQAEREE